MSELQERLKNRTYHQEAELRCKLNPTFGFYFKRIGIITSLIWLMNIGVLLGELSLSTQAHSIAIGLLSCGLYFYIHDRWRIRKELRQLLESRQNKDNSSHESPPEDYDQAA